MPLLPIVPAGSWASLKPPLSPTILETLDQLGFDSMTPVQSQAIPLLLKSKDVVVEAVTGCGKTLAYVIPVIELLLRKSPKLRSNEIGAIVLSPTRELAIQIYCLLHQFFPTSPSNYSLHQNEEDQDTVEPSPLSLGLYVGGASSSIEDDLAYFKTHGSHIMVATPGRLAELLKRGVGRAGTSGILSLKEFEVLIVDEADRLLDVGYARDFDLILAYLPKQRRTGLFSATMTSSIESLVRTGLRNPVKVNVAVKHAKTGERWRTPATLRIGAVVMHEDAKLCWLIQCMRAWRGLKTIVYFSTCAQVDYWYKVLCTIPASKAWPWYSLHGRQADLRRHAVYQQFVKADHAILLTTDLSARGLDIPNVDLVIQFDPPTVPEFFAHRAGRAGRNGRHGRAVIFLAPHEQTFIEFMAFRKVNIEVLDSFMWGHLVDVKRFELCDQDPDLQVPDTMVQQVYTEILDLAKSDRDVLEKGLCAFTSLIRAYSQHQLSYIFQLNHLDYLKLIHMHALVRVPVMPELRKAGPAVVQAIAMYELNMNVVVDQVPYLDRARELGRQQKLGSTSAKKKKLAMSMGQAWSEQKLRKQRRIDRREKRDRRQLAIRALKNGEPGCTASSSVKPPAVEVDLSDGDQDTSKPKKPKLGMEFDMEAGFGSSDSE